jgi:hypothetical protein
LEREEAGMTLEASPLQHKSFSLVGDEPGFAISASDMYLFPAGGDGHDNSPQSVGLIQ